MASRRHLVGRTGRPGQSNDTYRIVQHLEADIARAEGLLERNKLYVVLPDSDTEREGDVRVVDESGEDYLYPADWFVALELPKAVRH